MNVNKVLTKYNFSDRNDTKRIKYIVVHYFGGLSSAKNLATYWQSKYVGASAHYIVGHEGEIYQAVDDADIAWHCGAKSYKHKACRNSNSIGIEMAVRKKSTASMSVADKDWYFEQATIDATVELVKELMKKYNIPEQNVIRHFDVTGKTCPNPYCVNKNAEKLWSDFKKHLKETAAPAEPEVKEPDKKEPEKTETEKQEFEPYTVNTTCAVLNIRQEASATSKRVGQICEDGIVIRKKKYTIIEEKNGFGRLKSKAGWISLKYAQRVS